jgi:transposase
MISLPTGTNIWIAAGVTDLRRGFTGLSAVAQTVLEQDPYSGHVFVFRGRRGDLIKVLWWDGDGLCLFAKRLERTFGPCFWKRLSPMSICSTRLASTRPTGFPAHSLVDLRRLWLFSIHARAYNASARSSPRGRRLHISGWRFVLVLGTDGNLIGTPDLGMSQR